MQLLIVTLAIVLINLLGWFGNGVLCWSVTTYRWRQPVLQQVSTTVPRWRTNAKRGFALSSSAVEDEEETALQWALFQKYQARGSWRGIWTTYDYLGDVIDETVASVNLQPTLDQSEFVSRVDHTHTIVVGAKKSDCATCFDSFESKTIPVAVYTPGQLGKGRCASCAMVIGPSILRSGAMATELILSYGDGRVRVILYHAPVWQATQGEDASVEQVGPPDGLKLYRVMISKEALRSTAPTPETEAALLADNSDDAQPRFYRPVPPYAWHKKWGGTSWTWGPSTGNRGWRIEDMEEADAWHGRPTGDAPNVWSLRLNLGGILVQAPRVIVSGEAGLCRVAWLPNEETLLRVEASVLALEPIIMENDEEDYNVVGFHPPSLASLRCDLMQKTGDLEDLPRFVEDNAMAGEMATPQVTDASRSSTPQQGSSTATHVQVNGSDNENPGNVQDILRSLKL